MPFTRDNHLIFEKYVSLNEKVTVETILNILDNKNDKIAAKLIDMDKTPSKGHVNKLAKFFNETQSLDVLGEYYKKFLELKKRNRIEDITRFDKFSDLESAVDTQETKTNLNMPENVSDTEKPIYEDDQIKVIAGENRAKCIKLGGNYTFCISRPASGNLYSNYRLRDESNFYFVRVKTRTDEKVKNGYKDPAHLIVIDALPNEEFQWTWADNGNQGHGTKKVTPKEAIQEIPELKAAFEKGVFQSKPLTQDERDKIEKFNELANDFDLGVFNSLKYSEKEEFIQQGGLNLPFEAWKTLDKNLRNEYLKVISTFNLKIYEDLKENEKKIFEKFIQRDEEAAFEYFLYLNKLEKKISPSGEI